MSNRGMSQMILVCAWCGKISDQKEPLENPILSHGICESCGKEFIKSYHQIQNDHAQEWGKHLGLNFFPKDI